MEQQSSVCPVPREQQPINEYQQLKESCFFGWARLDVQGYIKKLGWIWLWSWLIAGPLAAESFAPLTYPSQFMLCGTGGASIFVALSVLRLYLGWSYVGSRLQRETVFYEESGWYDGQTWQKTEEILARDRLVATYEVEPILLRLKRTGVYLAIVAFGGSLIWNFL